MSKDPFATPTPKPEATMEEQAASALAREAMTKTEASAPKVNPLGVGVKLSAKAVKEAKPGDRYLVTRADQLGNPVRIEVGIEELTEEDLDTLPIEAKAFETLAMLEVKLKDKAFVPRYVNVKNQDGANIMRMKARGYTYVSIDEVEGGREGLIEGNETVDGTIRYIDVVLMKINKLRLFQHYKSNLNKSNHRLLNANTRAKSEAEGQLANESGAQLARARRAGHKAEFYNPNNETAVEIS